MKQTTLSRFAAVLLLLGCFASRSKAQFIVDFDQAVFTQNWMEDSYTFNFDANDDIRTYNAYSGSGHWFARGDMNAGYLSMFMNDFGANSIYLYTENASDISNLIIRGYDENNNNIISTSILNPASYQFSYGQVMLNFPRVRKLRIEYTNAGMGSVYADNLEVCPLATVITDPANQIICTSGPVSFSISDFTSNAYQWQEDQGGGFANISNVGIYSGANTNALNISNATAGMHNWHYRCIVTNFTCSSPDTSSSADLIFDNSITASLASQTAVSCSGMNDGTATVNVSFAAPPVSYVWSMGGSTSNTGTGLSAQSHTCTVFNGCANSQDIVVGITGPLPISITIDSQTDPTCSGGFNGSATVSAGGGNGSYSYVWLDGFSNQVGTGPSVGSLFAGTYNVQVTDMNLCQETQAVTLNNPPAVMTAITSQTDVDCNGNNNGSATVSGSSGAGGPYTYDWWGMGNFTDTQTGLSAGSYSCIVGDMLGCTSVQTVNITQPPVLTYSVVSQSNAMCSGGFGSANIIGLGGTFNYTYLWISSGETVPNASSLPAGFNNLVITDDNNCSVMPGITISEPPQIQPGFSVTDVSCFGGANGAITTAASGGTGTLYYLWTPGGATTPLLTGLPASGYTLTLSDDNGCSVPFIATVNEPSQVGATVISTPVSCHGDVNGMLSIDPNGGTPPYSLLWDGGSVNDTISPLAPGTYTCTVTDANNCVQNIMGTVAEPDTFDLFIGKDNPTCFGLSNGTAGMNITGGTAPYFYTWPHSGETTQVVGGLTAGTYTCNISDINGCTGSATTTLIDPLQFTISLTQTDTACLGASGGIATVSNMINGAGAPYTYAWSSGGTNITEGGLSGQSYTCTVIDKLNCAASSSITIFEFSTNITGHISTQSLSSVAPGSGWIYVFKYQPGGAGYDTVDIAGINTSSDYVAFNIPEGDYLVKAMLDDNIYPLSIPTYYGGAFQWDSAFVMYHGCTQNDTIDIEVLELSVATGPGVVSGYILEGDSFGIGARFNGHTGPMYPCVPGGPLKGIDVKLGKNPGGGIQARVMTDSTGYYEFTNLPLQGYKIYVDIPNLPMDSTREIVLDATNNVSIQNNYFADSAKIYVNEDTVLAVGIFASGKVYDNHFSIFPNPASSIMNLQFSTADETEVSFEIHNAIGELTYSVAKENYGKGDHTLSLQTRSLQLKAGVYFISIISDKQRYTQRIVVLD